LKEIIFKFNRIDLKQFIAVGAYLLLTAFVAFICISRNSQEQNDKLISIYTFLTQFLLYIINYRAFRNLSVYVLWLSVSLLHFISYCILYNNPGLLTVGSNSIVGLRNTLFLLILFQIFQIINIGLTGLPLVMPKRESTMDINNERNASILDYLYFLIYCAATIYLMEL